MVFLKCDFFNSTEFFSLFFDDRASRRILT